MRILKRPGPDYRGLVRCAACTAMLEYEGHDLRPRRGDDPHHYVVCAVCGAHLRVPDPPPKIVEAVASGVYHPTPCAPWRSPA